MHLHPEASVGALPMQGFAREQDWESSQGLGLGVWGLGFVVCVGESKTGTEVMRSKASMPLTYCTDTLRKPSRYTPSR